ncbi:MAG: ADP-ribosylglycohydrolase family protein [Erysipelotrichaceae bacterium]|nr:ADP-ribosylglycohydrolase family protein [Erysipelotrichaceae bacterium]
MELKKLTLETYQEYLNKTYASWLGKNIGIRLGAPIEGWTYEQIMEKYPAIQGYLVDYDIFAADDDSNGPLFFADALEHTGDPSAEEIGNVFLNVMQEYKGFFWWGGVGVSSEHTAYENLKNGIHAPESGSKKTNGEMIAEQIGGQIFSDCWGYVSGYDSKIAKDLARKAASVTHDGNGMEGATFVAVAICLAYQSDDIHEVLKETLKYLDPKMEYYRVMKDIMDYHETHPDDWRECLSYIHAHYGYDRYPGTCHIIPNSALMMMAMCYGENDFSKTISMLAQSGWDTDCNCGNVGSIMGALTGLEGIDPKWIVPINDIVNASSCIGCLNMQSISMSAQKFARYAMKLQGYPEPDFSHFVLPYATEGFRCKDHVLTVNENGLQLPKQKKVYHYSYYLPKDLYDARYDPSFSPIVYPGDTISFSIRSSESCTVTTGAEFADGTDYSITHDISGEQTIFLDVPPETNRVVHTFYLECDHDACLVDYRIISHPKVTVDFRDYPYDGYGPRYEGDTLYNIRAFCCHSGKWSLETGALYVMSEDHALITTGSLDTLLKEMEIEAENASICPELVFGFHGFMDYYSLGIRDDHLALIRKTNQNDIVLSECEIKSVKPLKFSIKVIFSDDIIHLYLNGERYDLPFDMAVKGAVGICLNGKGSAEILGFKFCGGA